MNAGKDMAAFNKIMGALASFNKQQFNDGYADQWWSAFERETIADVTASVSALMESWGRERPIRIDDVKADIMQRKRLSAVTANNLVVIHPNLHGVTGEYCGPITESQVQAHQSKYVKDGKVDVKQMIADTKKQIAGFVSAVNVMESKSELDAMCKAKGIEITGFKQQGVNP